MHHKISEYVNNIFEQPWWLDVVTPNSWEEILVKENDKVIARWPIVRSSFGIGMPELTQTLGFWISEEKLGNDPYLNERKRITKLLLEQLPKKTKIKIRLAPNVNYFLPMTWEHFIVKPYISYRIPDLTCLDSIFENFSKNTKHHIINASKGLVIKEMDNIEPLIVLMEKTFEKQNRKYPISKTLIRNIYETSKDYNACKLIYAIDINGNIHSGLLMVYDENVCYALIGGTDPVYKSSGSTSLHFWEGIRFASTVSRSFDFEGSMIEGIEHFFRNFGAKGVIYYEIRKQNIFLEMKELFKPRIKELLGYK